ANFNIGKIIISKEVKDKADLIYLTGISNYSFWIFNYSYASNITLTIISLLYYAY
ncbi:hypothetical protein DER44DRAFT_650622, partial [Fusarium oxysporum]